MAINQYGMSPRVGLGMASPPSPFDVVEMGQWGMPTTSDTTVNTTIPTVGGQNFGQLNFKDKAGIALAGLQTLGGLFAAFKQLSLANKQFDFQKKFANANMANSIQSYNTQLQDRARARAAMEGQSQAQMQQYIDQNRMAAWNGG